MTPRSKTTEIQSVARELERAEAALTVALERWREINERYMALRDHAARRERAGTQKEAR